MEKKALLHEARELFYQYGIKSVSMDDIARKLGMSKKTIYIHIDNKKDLVVQVIENFIKEEREAVEQIRNSSKDAIEEMMRIAFYVLSSLRRIRPSLSYDLKKYHPQAWKLIQEDHMEHINDVIQSNITRGMKEGFYREDIDVEIYARLYVGMARSVINPEEHRDPDRNYSELFRHVINYHMHGIMNTKGRQKIKTYLKNIEA